AAIQPPIGAATAESEPNNTTGQANAAANNYVSGAFSSLGDVDFYRFTAAAGDLILLGLDGDPLRNVTAINRGRSLWAPDGVPLVTVNDSTSTSSTASGAGNLASKTPNSPAEAIVWRATVSGTYYVRLSTATVGDYLLSIAIGCRTFPATDLSVTSTHAP